MKMLVEKTVGRNDDQFQINAICNIFRIVSPRNATSAAITKLVQEITPLKNLDEKLDHVISKFPVLRNSAEYYKAASLCALDRLKTISNYEWDYTKKVRAETTLLRPVAMAVKSSDDYGLSKCCEKKVEVYFVDGNHLTMLDSEDAAAIINRQITNTEAL
ncbi:uncharacterized protein LOC110835182 [Zootermopsis nevadensis]|uniref:uncharacterized protein LOC110835182 n=1 Tax=Zootermopsis nevadensis TaxID=136037 RepID=UPI000B8E5905|nr:uncharacterized protein LOC110835182 [Zootermopsis nevadensis]